MVAVRGVASRTFIVAALDAAGSLLAHAVYVAFGVSSLFYARTFGVCPTLKPLKSVSAALDSSLVPAFYRQIAVSPARARKPAYANLSRKIKKLLNAYFAATSFPL